MIVNVVGIALLAFAVLLSLNHANAADTATTRGNPSEVSTSRRSYDEFGHTLDPQALSSRNARSAEVFGDAKEG